MMPARVWGLGFGSDSKRAVRVTRAMTESSFRVGPGCRPAGGPGARLRRRNFSRAMNGRHPSGSSLHHPGHVSDLRLLQRHRRCRRCTVSEFKVSTIRAAALAAGQRQRRAHGPRPLHPGPTCSHGRADCAAGGSFGLRLPHCLLQVSHQWNRDSGTKFLPSVNGYKCRESASPYEGE